jgi:membrane-associated phospholipid phosphatase
VQSDAQPRGPAWKLRVLRLLLIAAALVVWFGTQALLAQRPLPARGISDRLFSLTASANAYFAAHPGAANGLLIVSSAMIDLLGLFLLLGSILGRTIRPFLGLLILFVLRQICQAIVALPAPEGMIWHNPGFPSLLVTYATAGDFFFSGHTAIAVYGAVELGRVKRWLGALGAIVAVFLTAVVIVLRVHYTMDIFAGIVAALWVAAIVPRLAPPVDRALARWAKS